MHRCIACDEPSLITRDQTSLVLNADDRIGLTNQVDGQTHERPAVVNLGPTIAASSDRWTMSNESSPDRRPMPVPGQRHSSNIHLRKVSHVSETGVSSVSSPTVDVAIAETVPSRMPVAGFDRVVSSDHAQPDAIVSDAFFETHILDAIHSLAEQAGVTVVIDDVVQGVVTATINQETFPTALRRITLPLEYVFSTDGKDYYIGSPDPDSALFPYLCRRYCYQVQHRAPEELLDRLPDRLKPFVRADVSGGRLVIETHEEIAGQILSEFENLDQPIPQVILEALVCVYSPETRFRFGFDFRQGVTLTGLDSAAVSFDSLGIGAQYNGLGVGGQLNDFRFTTTFLRALEQKGYVKIRAAPRVMAEDGQRAEIQIGRETFFSVQPNLNGVLLRQDVQKVESGIMLELTPRIRAPYVSVQIDRAEVSEDIRSEETSTGVSDRFPVINRRRVGTTVHVMDGQTIVIGGLTQVQKVDQTNKIRLLGDMPLLGRAFQRIERLEQETEVAIFIAPQIVCEDDHAAGY